MKKIVPLILFIMFSIAVSAQTAPGKKDPVGLWKFEAPYAPEGYTSGTIEVGLADNKYSAAMAFTGSEFKFIGEQVKFKNDSVFFSVLVEGNDVAVVLKIENETKMSGKATWSDGEASLELTKVVMEQKEEKK